MKREDIVETITTVGLLVLPTDLLYLFYDGAWTDPNKIILTAELILLYAFPAFAIWRFARYLRRKP